MKHTIFETRQRAEDLLREAIAIWRQSDFSEQLEGLEKDPVFGLLLSAVAYQANEIDSEIERLKSEVLEEYASMLTPYEIGHATPATVVLQTSPVPGVGEVELNSDSRFQLNDTDFIFTPILNTRVVNMTVRNVARLDGRRWSVEMHINAPVTDISKMTFIINNNMFRTLSATVNGKELELVHPWEYSELPMADNFTNDVAMYNNMPSYDPSMTNMDLFARHNLRMFCVKPGSPGAKVNIETRTLKIVFEFHDILEGFKLTKSQIILNPVVLANAMASEALLDATMPIARVSGVTDDKTKIHSQLVHLLPPPSTQIYAHENVTVRRIMGDRYNQGSLTRLLSSLLCKLKSDYYAYQYLNSRQSQHSLNMLRDNLKKMLSLSNQNMETNVTGTYLMLRPGSEASLRVQYVTTNGAAVNDSLNEMTRFTLPPTLAAGSTRQIAAPVHGTDEISSEAGATELVRYAITTNNRIVTTADIRQFCYNELLNRYGITRNLVSRFTVSQRLEPESSSKLRQIACGYEILVQITITNSTYVSRSFADRIPQTEIVLEKMMQVRSANIYPIRVKISLE